MERSRTVAAVYWPSPGIRLGLHIIRDLTFVEGLPSQKLPAICKSFAKIRSKSAILPNLASVSSVKRQVIEKLLNILVNCSNKKGFKASTFNELEKMHACTIQLILNRMLVLTTTAFE